MIYHMDKWLLQVRYDALGSRGEGRFFPYSTCLLPMGLNRNYNSTKLVSYIALFSQTNQISKLLLYGAAFIQFKIKRDGFTTSLLQLSQAFNS